jgi:hypothetical protein
MMNITSKTSIGISSIFQIKANIKKQDSASRHQKKRFVRYKFLTLFMDQTLIVMLIALQNTKLL